MQTKKQVKRNGEYRKAIVCKISPFKELTCSVTPKIVVPVEVADAIYDYATDLWITVNQAWRESVNIYNDTVDTKKFKIQTELQKSITKDLKEKMLSKIGNKSYPVYTSNNEVCTFIREWIDRSASITKGHVRYVCNNDDNGEIAEEVCNLLYDNFSYAVDELADLLNVVKEESRMYVMGFSFPI